MRVEEEGEEEDNMVPQTDGEVVAVDTASSQQKEKERLVIGYALTSKKKQSFLQPKLQVLAR